MPAKFSLAALATTCLLLCSCLDYDEEMTINKDLSGEVNVSLTLPDPLLPKYEKVGEAFEEAALRKRFEGLSGVSLESYWKSTDRKPVVKLLIRFSSLEKLNDAIAAHKPASIWGGKFTVTKADGKTKIERRVGEGDTLGDLPEHNNLHYKTHYAGSISATNTRSFDRAHNDTRYRYSLAELLARPDTQETVLANPFPWKWILISLAVLGAGAYYGWEALGKKKMVRVNPAPVLAKENVAVPVATPDPAPANAPAKPAGPAPKTPPSAPPAAPPAATPSAGPTPPAKPGPGGPPRPQRPGPPGPRPPGKP